MAPLSMLVVPLFFRYGFTGCPRVVALGQAHSMREMLMRAIQSQMTLNEGVILITSFYVVLSKECARTSQARKKAQKHQIAM